MKLTASRWLFLSWLNLSLRHSTATSIALVMWRTDAIQNYTNANADDTKCSCDIRDPESSSLLQSDINNLLFWSQKWKLHFNESKCVLLQFRLSNKSPPKSYYFIGENPIQTKDSHKDLGVIMQTNLKWNSHYDSICSKAYRTLYLLKRTFSPSTSELVKRRLYISLVRSQLMYCSPLWRPMLIKDIKKLESLQKRATKFILGPTHYGLDYI